MKTTIIAFLLASLLGAAIRISGHPFDANVLCAVGFASGLGAWAFALSERRLPSLTARGSGRKIRPTVAWPFPKEKAASRRTGGRLAA